MSSSVPILPVARQSERDRRARLEAFASRLDTPGAKARRRRDPDMVERLLASWRSTVKYLEREAVTHQSKGRISEAADAMARAAKLRADIRRYEP